MERHKFDLDQEMLEELSFEFDPVDFVKGLELDDARSLEGNTASFEEYGRNLALSSIEKGERRPDRVYEVMNEAVAKTGEMKFPLVPQRYIELAYLGIQPFRRLWVVQNNSKVFSYKLNKCSVFDAITRWYGEKTATKMMCRAVCFALLKEIFAHFDFSIKASLEADMASNGRCQFKIEQE